MTEAETKHALEDETKIAAVLGAITEVFRRRYQSLIPKALGFLQHPNEVFRAKAIGSYFNFMGDVAVAETERALRLLKEDPSSMVRSASARALANLTEPSFPERITPSLRLNMLRAIADALRADDDDRARSGIFSAFWLLSGEKHDSPPLDLSVDDVDWKFVDAVVAAAETAAKP